MVKGILGFERVTKYRETHDKTKRQCLKALIVAIGTVQFWRERPIYGVQPMTLQLAFWPALISGDDIDGDSWVSARMKRNGLKD